MGFPYLKNPEPLKTAEPLTGDTLLLTYKFIGFPGTHLIGPGWIKGRVNHYAMAPNNYIVSQNNESLMVLIMT